MVTWLSEAIAARNPFAFGELAVEPWGSGWLVRGPHAGAAERSLVSSPAALRHWSRFDDSCRYRPLSGARSLPRDWTVELPTDRALDEALEAIYPLAARHITMGAAGALRTTSLEDVLRRQSGRYESASALSEDSRAAAVSLLCGACVRTPAWDAPDAGSDAGAIPCPEPCSVMVSFCREAAAWEKDPPSPSPVDSSAGFADFETPGNELREAWLSQRPAPTSPGAN